jgi:hypothetical protein
MDFSNCSASSVRWFVEHSNDPSGAISGIASITNSS